MRSVAVVIFAVLVSACSSGGSTPFDGGFVDAAAIDALVLDADQHADANESLDAGFPDAEPIDSGSRDSGLIFPVFVRDLIDRRTTDTSTPAELPNPELPDPEDPTQYDDLFP